MVRHPGLGEQAAPRRFFLLLPATGLEPGHAARHSSGRRRGALARREGWGTGVEFLPRKEGWCGGKVRRYNTNIQVICGGGERGSLGRHLSLVHREEKDTIYKAVRL